MVLKMPIGLCFVVQVRLVQRESGGRDDRPESLEHHVHRRLLGAGAVGGVHFAEVPLDAEEDVAAHDEAVGVLFVVGGDRVG